MRITVYKCDLCKHLFAPTEEPILIRGTERDICPSCLDQLVKRFESEEPADNEGPVKVEEKPEPKAEAKPKKEDKKKPTREDYFRLFENGLSNPEVTKQLNTGAGNTSYWRKRWEVRKAEKEKES